jgi:hypothetical protein
MINVLTLIPTLMNTGAIALVPHIDGRSLVEKVTEFEELRGYDDPAGGYGGIVPAYFNLGPLPSYFHGNWVGIYEPGFISVLFCECGEEGCWPLIVNVSISSDQVLWTQFRNPRREWRDYSAFGPFLFERGSYDAVVDAASRLLDLDTGPGFSGPS